VNVLIVPPGPTLNGSSGSRMAPGGTWVVAPGCYGWQIDGLTFSYVVIFRAVVGQLHCNTSAGELEYGNADHPRRALEQRARERLFVSRQMLPRRRDDEALEVRPSERAGRDVRDR
jgi:hypothetical protein